MIKAIKIQETFEDFLEEHPELEVIQNDKGHIISITFPKEAEKTSYTIVYGEVVSLYYEYKGSEFHFPF